MDVLFSRMCSMCVFAQFVFYLFWCTLTVSAYLRIQCAHLFGTAIAFATLFAHSLFYQCGTATAFASGSGRFFSHIPYFTFSMLIFSVVHSTKRKEVPRC